MPPRSAGRTRCPIPSFPRLAFAGPVSIASLWRKASWAWRTGVGSTAFLVSMVVTTYTKTTARQAVPGSAKKSWSILPPSIRAQKERQKPVLGTIGERNSPDPRSELDEDGEIQTVLDLSQIRREPPDQRSGRSGVSAQRRDAAGTGEIRYVGCPMVVFPTKRNVLAGH